MNFFMKASTPSLATGLCIAALLGGFGIATAGTNAYAKASTEDTAAFTPNQVTNVMPAMRFVNRTSNVIKVHTTKQGIGRFTF